MADPGNRKRLLFPETGDKGKMSESDCAQRERGVGWSEIVVYRVGWV